MELVHVLPAKAGIQQNQIVKAAWMPASAGMTRENSGSGWHFKYQIKATPYHYMLKNRR